MTAVDGGPVVAHAQAFADEINRRFGFTHIMTYPTHEPDQQHALDCFHTREVMFQMAMWAIKDDVIATFDIDYVIHDIDPGNADPGEIYNPEIARRWREMQNRGGPTQNHYDHVHVSFNKRAGDAPGSQPEPQPSATKHKEYEPMIVHAGESLPYPVPKGATSGLISFEDGGAGPCKAKIVVGHGPKTFRPAFPQGEEVEVGVGTSPFPIKDGDNFIRVHNLDDKGRALTVGVEF